MSAAPGDSTCPRRSSRATDGAAGADVCHSIRMRSPRLKTGATTACGSGACAAAVVSILRGVTERRVRVELRGGQLEIAWPADDAHVEMTGPAAHVFEGRIRIEGD